MSEQSVHAPDNVVMYEGDAPRWLQFTVPGIPVAQGSKRHVGGGKMIEMLPTLKPWRQEVVAAMEALELPHEILGPVECELTFTFKRPRYHYGTGRNTDKLKPGAASYHASHPDIDKLCRAVLDAMTIANLIRDDGQVAVLVAAKRYGVKPGLRASVRPLT